jgi:hypothetical protein
MELASGLFDDSDLGMALAGGQLDEVDARSEGGKLEFDLSIQGLMQLLVDFSALAIVDLYLSGIAVVRSKSKPKLICKGIGKGDGGKGREELQGGANNSAKEPLAEVGTARGKGTRDATLSDRLLQVEPSGSGTGRTPHRTNALVAKRLAEGTTSQP